MCALCLCDYGLRMDLRGRHKTNPYSDSIYSELSRTVSWLIDRIDAYIIFIPFYISENDDDRRPAENISKQIRSDMQSRILKLNRQLGPRETKWVISRCKYVIGTRLHSLIFSVSETTPILGINYEPKISNFMKDMGLNEFVFNYENINAEEITDKILKLDSNYQEYQRKLMLKANKGKKMAFDGIRRIANAVRDGY